jgi:uncharacterized membrane protein
MFDTNHLHPMLVHFPVALTMVGALLEVIRLFFHKTWAKWPCGEIILYLATISSVFALLSGLLFTSSFAGKPLEVRNMHLFFAMASTVVLLINSFFYLLNRFGKQDKKIFYIAGLLLYALSALLIGITGFLGGTLVYNYMIGL